MLLLPVDEELDLFLLQEQHAEPLFAMVDVERERLRTWLPWVDRTRKADDVRAYIQDSLRRFAEGTSMIVGIRYKGDIVGGSGLRIDVANHRCEIGYWLAGAYEGRGIVTRTARALTAYAIRELGLHRIEIRCATGNLRSGAIPERLGFVYEGTFRESFLCNGEYQDIRIYSYLAPQRLH